jgi:hypothetical protein
LTRTELLATLARRLNKNTTLDSTTQSRLLDFINETHRQVLGLPGAARLRDEVTSFATVADQHTYALVNVARPTRIFEPNNRRVLREVSRDDWRNMAPDATDITGVPDTFVWLGYSPVAKNPSNASELFVDSTSASDTTQVAYLEGEITGGYPMTASVTLTGQTAVTLSSTITTWERITKFYLSAAPAGVVTLHEDASGGTELARIGIGRTAQPYTQIALYPTPSAVVTHYIDYQAETTDLAQSTDVPRLPVTFHDLLIYGAMALEYEHMQDERAGLAQGRYGKRIKEFKQYLAETATGDAGGFETPSRLGAWFSSGGA